MDIWRKVHISPTKNRDLEIKNKPSQQVWLQLLIAVRLESGRLI